MPSRSLHARWAYALVGAGFLTLAGARQAKTSNLAGSWKFNPDKTAESAKEAKDPKVQEARKQRGRMPTPTSGITRSGGSESGSGGAGPAGAQGPLGLYARPLPQLVIEQTDSTVSISDPSGNPRIYHTDGKKRYEPLLGADTLEISARWGKDGRLTTERKLGSFGSIREIFSLDPGTHELRVEVRLSGGSLQEPIDLRHIYDQGS